VQAKLESEREASKAALADEQEARAAQVSWRSAARSACLKMCLLQAWAL